MSNNFTGITFANQRVSPSNDGMIRNAIFGTCILTGCDLSCSGFTLTMQPGYLMIYGRQVRLTAVQNWAFAASSTALGRVVLTIDLSKTATPESFEQIDSYVEYTDENGNFPAFSSQQNINAGGIHYNAVICEVLVDAVTGIVEIVDQLPHYNRPLNTAPSGYGIGNHDAQFISDFSQLFHHDGKLDGGLYYATTSSKNFPWNSPGLWRGLGLPGGSTSNEGDTILYIHPNGWMALQSYRNNVLNEPKWILPPMTTNREYALAEYYGGKPVYCKLIDLGTLPNTSQKTVETGITAMSALVRAYGSAVSSVQKFIIPCTPGTGHLVQFVLLANNNIRLTTTADLSGYTATATLFYTKD